MASIPPLGFPCPRSKTTITKPVAGSATGPSHGSRTVRAVASTTKPTRAKGNVDPSYPHSSVTSMPLKLNSLFAPRSIAVVGASNNMSKLGGQFFERLLASSADVVIPVHPTETAIMGREAAASIADVSGTIDLLIALVPAETLLDVVRSCPPGKVAFLAAIPSGFGEVGGDGPERQIALAQAARERGMRLIGPNTAGLFSGPANTNASLIPNAPMAPRGVSCVTQSGGFGMALSMYALDHGLPVARFCDLGNLADMQYADVLTFLADDPATTAVGVFIESTRDESGTLAALRNLSRRKPVFVSSATKTEAGQRASRNHLGVTPSLTRFLSELSNCAHVVETSWDLMNALKARHMTGLLGGRRVGILTGTGGLGAELADLVTSVGLKVPEFSAELRRTLLRELPPYAGVANPVDFTPIWREYPKVYPAVMRHLAASGEVDALLVAITDVPTTVPDLADAMSSLPKLGVPAFVYWGSRDADVDRMYRIQASGIPCYRNTRETALALAAAAPLEEPLPVP